MKKVIIVITCLFVISCSKSDSNNQDQQSEWLVDETEITGLLALYPLIINPEFTAISNSDLDDSVLVGALNFGTEIRVYPYSYMSVVEIVNDVYNGQKYAFSYCPITKSSVAFNREMAFRASGYLYKENLTPWHEATESIFSQMLLKGIRGPEKNISLNTIPVLETNLGTIRESYPNAKILMTDDANRSSAPPPDDTDDSEDSIPDIGELAYGIINGSGEVNIFRYSDFSGSGIINVSIDNQDYIVYGNSTKQVINAFKVLNTDNYEAIYGEFPFVFKDNNGVKYDIFGRGNNGTALGKPKYAYVAIWRAWDDFFDNFTFH